MTKIIFTILLSSLVSGVAIAEDRKMHNSSPNSSLMSKKHMMNANTEAPLMSKRHMMNTSPYSSGNSNDGTGKTNAKKGKGYRVIKYKK